MVVGILVGAFVPDARSWITRALLGWNTATWLYLVSVGWMMFHADAQRLQRVAEAQAESAFAVLMIGVVAAAVSIAAVVLEVAAAKSSGAHHAGGHLLFVAITVLGSWLLLPTLFALNYASRYHANPPGRGLIFPREEGDRVDPDYADFLYFSFTIAVASQTADIAISTRELRRLVLLQALLSFAFNTMIVAFTINIAASLF